MNLQMLSFDGDKILDRRIKEASNYCDNSYLYTRTFGISQLILSELSPIDLDGHGRLTVAANIEQQMVGTPRYHRFSSVSVYNLDPDTSRILYQFKKFDQEFWEYASRLLLDVLAEIDRINGGKNRLTEKREEILKSLLDCDFHKEILLEKFSKTSKDRKYKANVYRCLSPDTGEAIRAELIHRASGRTAASKWMTAVPGYVYRASQIRRTYWEGNQFWMVSGKAGPQVAASLAVPDTFDQM